MESLLQVTRFCIILGSRFERQNLTKIRGILGKNSEFALNKILNLEVNINKFEFGNHFGSYIKLPDEISTKQLVIM